MLLDEGHRGVGVVEGQHDGVVKDALGYPPALGEGQRTLFGSPERGSAHEEVVITAVEVALELSDLGPAGEGPGDPHRHVNCFRPGVHEAHHLHVGHVLLDPPGQDQGGGRRGDGAGPGADLLRHGIHDRRRRMPQDVGAPADERVDVPVAVHIP